MNPQLLPWILFHVFVLAMLALDIGVLHRKSHAVGFKEAAAWSVFWIALALAFNGLVYLQQGRTAALEFLTGYVIEKALSVDNLFVFLLIFTYFRVPAAYQHKVLFWGIVGALVMRGIFIAAGITLINRFHWLLYVFGAFLVYTGVKLAMEKDKEVHPEKNPVLRLFRKMMPVTEAYEGSKFWVKRSGRLMATPLLVVLVVVESTDVVFAVDSIPAVLAVTRDPFIVYTSNIFAILGLRALYFLLAGLLRYFHHLHYGLSVILVFVGLKMLTEHYVHVPVHWSLAIVGLLLAASVIASILWPARKPAA